MGVRWCVVSWAGDDPAQDTTHQRTPIALPAHMQFMFHI